MDILNYISSSLSVSATHVSTMTLIMNITISVIIYIYLIFFCNLYGNCNFMASCLVILFIGIFFMFDKYHAGKFIGSHLILSAIIISVLTYINIH